jgi:hypothetical protein
MSFLTDAANEVEGLKDKMDSFAGQVENALNINNLISSAFNGLFGGGGLVGDTATAMQNGIANAIPSSATNILEWLQWMVKTIQAVLDVLLSLAEAILRVVGAIVDAVEAVVNFFSSW